MGDDWPEITVEGFQSRFDPMRVKIEKIKVEYDTTDDWGFYRGGENLPYDPTISCKMEAKAIFRRFEGPDEDITVNHMQMGLKGEMPHTVRTMFDDVEKAFHYSYMGWDTRGGVQVSSKARTRPRYYGSDGLWDLEPMRPVLEKAIAGGVPSLKVYEKAYEMAAAGMPMSEVSEAMAKLTKGGPCIGIAETTAKAGEVVGVMLAARDATVAGINRASDALRETLTGSLDDKVRPCPSPFCNQPNIPYDTVEQMFVCPRCWTKLPAEDDPPSTDTNDVKPLVFEEVP